MIDHTHDPRLTSWVPGADGHRDFPIQNLPLGCVSLGSGAVGPATAIGDHVLALGPLEDVGLVTDCAAAFVRAARGGMLNAALALGDGPRRALRHQLSALLATGSGQAAQLQPHLHAASDAVLHLPARIGDYTDFYVGIHHATAVGTLLRPDNPLLPNYKWVPIGYHGRASSIRVSGTPVRRPRGQLKTADAPPCYLPSRRMDYELELGLWIAAGNALGEPIPIAEAGQHIAGYSLLNDWSARDVQTWEYQPLGPFLAKNFATTVSPWIVTPEALAPFRVAQAPRDGHDPAPLPYLFDADDQAQGALACTLEVALSTAAMRAAGTTPERVALSDARHMYWTPAQLVTHHSSGGCDLRPGDLLGTGTLSAPGRDGAGSLIETTRGGTEPVHLASGETRTFLEDGDEVVMRGWCEAPDRVRIGFGECRAIVMPAR